MAFTSVQFVIFLIIVATLYFLTPKRYRWVTLFVMNYVFYFMAGAGYFVYLIATTVTIYFAAVKLGRMATKNKVDFAAVKAELDKEQKRRGRRALRKENAGF